MRIYISADIEGIAGVASRDALSPGRFEYEQARDWMTDAVIASCETAFECGAEDVVVSDSHGNGQNIRYERMPPRVQLVRSWPRPLGMMQGIEVGKYAGALLVGYHAGATSFGGTLAHTISGELFQEICLNGRTMSEAGISAAIAGHFGVPVLMVAGDDVAVAETTSLVGEMATACLKTSLGFQSMQSLSPAAADSCLRDAVREALKLTEKRPPFILQQPIVVDIRLRTRLVAEWASYLPMIERVDAFSIRFTAEDMIEVSKFFQFLTSARGVLAG